MPAAWYFLDGPVEGEHHSSGQDMLGDMTEAAAVVVAAAVAAVVDAAVAVAAAASAPHDETEYAEVVIVGDVISVEGAISLLAGAARPAAACSWSLHQRDHQTVNADDAS